MTLPDVYTAANIFLGLIVAVLNARYWRRSTKPWRWIKGVYAFVGLAWSAVYFIALVAYDTNMGPLGPLLVRPVITITLAALASGAIIRNKSI